MRHACLIIAIAACGQGFTAPETSPQRETRCSVADDCDESPTPCQRPECIDGSCRYTPVEAGRLPPMLQDIGDCQTKECDGEGNVVDVEDNGDKPEETDDCFQPTCEGGEPTQMPYSQGTPCGNATWTTCDGAGRCKGCMGNEDCARSLQLTCCEGECCGATQVCQEGHCVDPI